MGSFPQLTLFRPDRGTVPDAELVSGDSGLCGCWMIGFC